MQCVQRLDGQAVMENWIAYLLPSHQICISNLNTVCTLNWITFTVLMLPYLLIDKVHAEFVCIVCIFLLSVQLSFSVQYAS